MALGRLQRYADGALEVGGFWVREDRRGRGLARALVRHVLEACSAEEDVWCIPFDHLTEFYLSFGMQRVSRDSCEVPCSLQEKMDWCEGTYPLGTYSGSELLVLRR